jgi:hypothetical protein
MALCDPGFQDRPCRIPRIVGDLHLGTLGILPWKIQDPRTIDGIAHIDLVSFRMSSAHITGNADPKPRTVIKPGRFPRKAGGGLHDPGLERPQIHGADGGAMPSSRKWILRAEFPIPWKENGAGSHLPAPATNRIGMEIRRPVPVEFDPDVNLVRAGHGDADAGVRGGFFGCSTQGASV